MSGPRLSRRRFLGVAGATVGAALAPGALIDKALAVGPAGGSLSDIKHVVMLMQENRSFDHYFGTMRNVRGFGDRVSYQSYAGGPYTDPATVLDQTTVSGGRTLLSVGGQPYLSPFELTDTPPQGSGQALNDITHDWGPQHACWNNGRMDRFAVEHLLADGTAPYQFASGPGGAPIPSQSTAPIGIETMGYYRERDHLDFYRALARAFTICDAYYSSVIGPTDSNRLMWMTGSLGAHSADKGGPVLETYTNRQSMAGTLEWPTLPELLTAHGVSWKVYQDPTSTALFNILPYFKNFAAPSTTEQAHNAALGLAPVYPAEFAADVAAGTLPQVTWIMTPAVSCEHPAAGPAYGEFLVSQILQILVANPEVWASTVFVVNYDENGGFFDHVAPPTPGPAVTSVADLPSASGPGGTLDGEYVTTANPTNAAGGAPATWGGVLGPVGLGFRVPALIVSPFSAGGWVCPDVFDHISTQKLIETLFLTPGSLMGGEGLHISPWRYQTVGDMTSALPTLANPVTAVPPLPPTSITDADIVEQNVLGVLGTGDVGPAYPVPAANSQPVQDEPGPTQVTARRNAGHRRGR